METKANWVTAKPEDIKQLIIELAKSGLTAEKIGLALRDQHGIPRSKVVGLKISKVLKEANMWKDAESEGREKKIDTLSKHAAVHKHDYGAIRSLTQITALNTRLKKR